MKRESPGPGDYDPELAGRRPESKFGNACFQSKIKRSQALSSASPAPAPNYYFAETHSLLKKSESLRPPRSPQQNQPKRKEFNLQLHATSVKDLIDRVLETPTPRTPSKTSRANLKAGKCQNFFSKLLGFPGSSSPRQPETPFQLLVSKSYDTSNKRYPPRVEPYPSPVTKDEASQSPAPRARIRIPLPE